MTKEEKMQRLDPVILNAFADGELEPEQAARVVMHLADCPEDQAIVDRIMAMNTTLARACEGPLHEPVPAAIRETIFGRPVAVSSDGSGRVIRFALARRAAFAATGALAAALALAVIVMPRADSAMLALGPLEPRSPMSEALDELASGQTRLVERNTELGILATFPVQNGYCREFSLQRDKGLDQVVGLACSDAGGWTIAARQTDATASDVTGYVPASGDDAEDPIGAHLDMLGAGLVLTPEQEAEALRAGWH